MDELVVPSTHKLRHVLVNEARSCLLSFGWLLQFDEKCKRAAIK